MTPELTASVMVALFILGFAMVVVGGVGFMRGNLVLMDNRSRIAQGSVFALAAFMFVAGIGVHWSCPGKWCSSGGASGSRRALFIAP
jgi:hypothetical protein